MPEEHNPFENALRDRLAKEAKQKEEKEEQERAAKKDEERAKRERLVAEEAAKPQPSGPPMAEFLELVAQAPDKDARLGLLKGRAGDLFKQGFPTMAADLYSRALSLQPSHTLYGNRSACLCSCGDYAAALDDALACVRTNPEWPKGYARQGAALHGLHRFDDAVLAFEEGLKREGDNAALKEGLADALRRRKAAGGRWEVAVDGSHSRCVQSKAEEEKSIPQLGGVVNSTPDVNGKFERPHTPLSYLCAAPNGYLVAADGLRPKILSLRTNHVAREFNTQYHSSGAFTFNEAPSGAAIDHRGIDPAFYAVEPGKGRLLRLLIKDTRSAGAKKEEPDKIMKEVHGKRELDLNAPRGLALVDTSRMGGGGADTTLYVCDSGNGRLLALEPKEFEPRFEVGRPGSGDGELDTPVSVCACGDYLAVADAGNWRVCLFTLRGTFIRSLGERASKFAVNPRAGQFTRPPAHVALQPGHLFVLEESGTRIHVLDPQTGEARGTLMPPYNAKLSTDAKGGLDRTAPAEGCLTGLCVDEHAIYVGSNYGPPRILALPRTQTPPPPTQTPVDVQ